MSSEEILKYVMDAVNKSIDELKDSIRRVHERLDEMYKAGLITRGECENYRRNCPACQDAKEFVTKDQHEKDIRSVKGYPAWVVVLFSVCAALITFVATKGVH